MGGVYTGRRNKINMAGCCDFTPDPQPTGTIDTSGWCGCMVNMVRCMGSIDESEFTDQRLCDLLVCAAFTVSVELQCCPGFENITVTPDCPLDAELILDNPSFANLVIFKALCLLDIGRARSTAAAAGIRATCGPATLQVASSTRAYQDLFEFGACASYKSLKEDLCFRCPMVTGQICAQVVGAFTTHYRKYNCCGRGRDHYYNKGNYCYASQSYKSC